MELRSCSRLQDPNINLTIKLCNVCRSIDFATGAPNKLRAQASKHHPSLKHLTKAARGGCQLCWAIFIYGRRRSYREYDSSITNQDQDQLYYHTFYCDSLYDRSRPGNIGATKISFFQKSNVGKYEQTGISFTGDLFVNDDSVAANLDFIRGRPIEKRPDSERCFDLIHKWTYECITEHGNSCPRAEEPRLPTRVIEVSPQYEPRLPKVLVTGRVPGTWLALSHCWGLKARFVLDSSNLLERQCGMAMADLPPTFRDAIEVTRRLGYRYLWIDSLCILQDSYEDWEMESGRMTEYYQNALLTIALDDTPGDHFGFLHQVRKRYTSVIAIPFQSIEVNGVQNVPAETSLPIEKVHLRYSRRKRNSVERFEFPLSKRGWTLQEDILAVRTVHYHLNQLRWECQKHRKVEGVRGDITGYIDSSKPLKHLFLSSSTNNITGGSWYRIVENYVSRELTVPEDKFPAMSGIARELSKQTGFSYRVGIWLEDFHRGLLWACHGRDDMADKTHRCDSYVAPTWSWGSIKTIQNLARHTIYRYEVDSIPDIKAQLLDCKITPRGNDPFGQITHATITLHGLWLPLLKWKSTNPILLGQCAPRDRVLWPRSIECKFDQQLSHPDWCSMRDSLVDPGSNILQNLYLLQIAILPGRQNNSVLASHFLILMPAATFDQFRRVGVAEAFPQDFFKSGDWAWRNITII